MNQSIPLPSLLIQRLFSLAVFAITAYAVADYPFARDYLALVLVIYAIGIVFQPSLWLLVLPWVLPLVNLAPWSGRFYLEDFDFFISTTIACALWQGAYSRLGRPRFANLPSLLIAGFLLTHCIALIHGLWPFPSITLNAFNNYYSSYNALRVGKALLWAVLLIPPLLRVFTNDREIARSYLVLGVGLGIIGTGIAMLWERGALTDLIYGGTIYEKIRGLTDFSTEYRATALFAEMHTGGEAIDGYIALAWPFALAGLAANAPHWKLATSIIALPAGLYSALVTFSRGTYMAVAVSLLTFAVPYSTRFLRHAAANKGTGSIPVIVLAIIAGCALLYSKGGYYAMVAAFGIFAGSLLLSFLKIVIRELRALLLAAIFLAGFALMMRGLLTSKWVVNGMTESLAICLPISVATLLAGIFIGTQVREIIKLRGLGISLAFALSLIAVCVPSLSGSYMKSRFATAENDAGGRMEHWRHAIGLMDSSWHTPIFGMGLGVFPHAYLWGKEHEKSSIAALQDDGINTYLSLSNSMDLAMGQRVNLAASQPYMLTLDAKTQAAKATVSISLCRRNIIVPWDSDCVSTSKIITAGPWQKLSWSFNIGDIGDGLKLGRRPLALRVTHFYYDPKSDSNMPLDFIDIDNIAVIDREGVNHVINGDFQSGLDHWYPSSDHYHLPLHIKNLWVNIYFEQGLFGLAAFCGLLVYGLACGVRQAKQGDVFGLTLLASLTGFLSVGLIGTLYDVPRVSFLFFLLLFTLLAQEDRQLTSFGKPRGTASSSGRRRKRSFVRPVLPAPSVAASE